MAHHMDANHDLAAERDPLLLERLAGFPADVPDLSRASTWRQWPA